MFSCKFMVLYWCVCRRIDLHYLDVNHYMQFQKGTTAQQEGVHIFFPNIKMYYTYMSQ